MVRDGFTLRIYYNNIHRVTTLTYSRVEISDEEECGLSEVLTKLKEFGALPR